MKTVEDAIKLLAARGYPVKELRLHQWYSDESNWLQLELPDAFVLFPPEITTDEYFKSFNGDKAPPFSFRLLTVGRRFTLSRGQIRVLKDRFSVPTSNQATIVDLDPINGRCSSITFYFASRGKSSKLRLGGNDLISWWKTSKVLDDQYEAKEKLKVGKTISKRKFRGGRQSSSKRGLEAFADQWLKEEFGI